MAEWAREMVAWMAIGGVPAVAFGLVLLLVLVARETDRGR